MTPGDYVLIVLGAGVFLAYAWWCGGEDWPDE